jgi:predicted anti-sigma-YlaC factor YlaD
MGTDQFTEKISLWLDHELSQLEVTELQTHMVDCPACRQTYQAMQGLERLLGRAAVEMKAPQPGFSQRFATRLAQHQPVSRRPSWWGIAALLLLFITALAGGATMTLSTWLDAGGWVTAVLAVVDTLRTVVSLGTLLLKAGLLTLSQPLFWGYTLLMAGLAWLWLRIIQTAYQQRPVTA